jgi:hypothetical protein
VVLMRSVRSELNFLYPCSAHCPTYPLVPVYDGRARKGRRGFSFSDADFSNLSKWPLYKGGATEVPDEAVVSVGYTLGTYRGSSGPVLSSNVMFVILLAI